MAGFLGLRGHKPQNPYDRERKRREEARHSDRLPEKARRAQEKVQEILSEQDGDMSAYTGSISTGQETGDAERIAARPVGDIMSARVAALSFDDDLLTVQGIFASVKFRHLPVVDEHERIIGIISDRDFLRVVSPFFGTVNEQNRDNEIMARKVGTIMTRKPVCATLDMSILDAVKLMNGRKISCLPVIKKESEILLGIVTWKDIVRAFCQKAFNNERESVRLRSGVRINPEASESARLRARTKQSTRILENYRQQQKETHQEETAKSTPSPSSRPESGRKSGNTEVIHKTSPDHQHQSQHQHQPPPPSRKSVRSDTRRITIPHSTPKIAATEKLEDRSTAGRGGSDLAARQKALLREQIENARQQYEKSSDDDSTR